jgi:multiple sugar transport system ATP-binding protein
VAEVRLEGITKSYGEVQVIRDLDLTIRDGEFFTLVGPSGCGKTTLLNMIAGLEAITHGRLLFDGKDVSRLSPKERDVAMVFQSYALYPHMTTFDNVAFPLRMRKMAREAIKSEVGKMASLLGLEGLLKRKPADLSGGQRQRVALARALVRRPKVFLLDEPLSNLDAQLRMSMRAELKNLQRELRITTIFVTHDQGEAMSLSDRMGVFNDGVMQQCGPPLEVYRNPANVFVGAFIGSPSMNIMDATVAGTDPPRIDCNGLSFEAELEEGLRPHDHDIVTVGLRPDNLEVSREEEGDSVRVSVSLVEPAGAFDWVDARWRDATLKARAAADLRLKPGERVFMKVADQRVLIFEKTTGKRIGRSKHP